MHFRCQNAKMGPFSPFGAPKCKMTPFSHFSLQNAKMHLFPFLGPFGAFWSPGSPPPQEVAGAGDDRRPGEGGEWGGGAGGVAGAASGSRAGELSIESSWCQRAPRPEVVPLHSYPRRGLTGITSAGLRLCSTFAVFGFAVHLQHLHLQYLHRHLHYLQLLHCSMDSVLHCCSYSAVWNAAKETPGIVGACEGLGPQARKKYVLHHFS